MLLLQGLGADFSTLATDTTAKTFAFNPEILATIQEVATASPLPKGACSADGMFIWDFTADGVGFWRRLRVGEQCTSTSTVPGPDVREHREGMPSSCTPETLENCPGGVYVAPTKVMQVGPFTIPVVRSGAEYTWGLDAYEKLNDEQAAMLKQQLSKKIDYPGRSNWIDLQTKWTKYAGFEPAPGSTSYRYADDGRIIATSVWPQQAPWGTWLTYFGWLKKIGFLQGDPGYDDRYMGFAKDRYTPIATFKHPDTDRDYGLWARIEPVGPLISAVSTQWAPDVMADVSKPPGPDNVPGPDGTTSFQLQFMVAPLPDKGLLGDFWDWIMKHVLKVVVGFYEGVWDVAEDLSSTLCAMAQTPGTITSAGSKAGPYGTAVSAAVETAINAAGNCPVPNPTPEGTPGPVAKSTPWALYILGGAAVVALGLLLTRKPKKTTKLDGAVVHRGYLIEERPTGGYKITRKGQQLVPYALSVNKAKAMIDAGAI